MVYPYYYPYFSARNVIPSTTSKLQSQIPALRRSQLSHQKAVKQQKRQGFRRNRRKQQLRVKQNIDQMYERQIIEAEVSASKCRQKVYQQELKQMRQQQYLKLLYKIGNERAQLKYQYGHIQSFGQNGLDSQSNRLSHRNAQQYHQELLRKLQLNKQNLQQNRNHLAKTKHIKFKHFKKQKSYIQKAGKGHAQATSNKYRRKSISFSNPSIINEIHKSKANKENSLRLFSTLDADRGRYHQTSTANKLTNRKEYFSCSKINKNQSDSRNIKSSFTKQSQFKRSKSRKNKNKSNQCKIKSKYD